MKSVKYSRLLELLLQRAKEVKKDEPTATAEKILVSAINMIVQNEMDDNAEVEELARLFNKDKGALIALRNDLMEHINKEKASFNETYYIQKKLLEASNQAGNEEQEELTAAALISCILKEPSDFLKQCFSGKKEEAETKESREEKRKEALKKLLEDMGMEEEDEEDEEGLELEPSRTPKEQLAQLTEQVKNVQKTLLSTVFGQDHAVSAFTSGYFQGELLSMTDKKRVRPRAIFLFAGPPGVGKTFLAEKGAEALGLPFCRFDMSEYADRESGVEFCGLDKAYKDAKEGNVTGFVKKHPQSVLLFDEIEKAHINVIHFFLQMLDAGRLRDNYTDKEVSFKDTILIFTTNAGKNLYENSESGDYSGISRKVILKALEKDVNPSTGVPFFPAAICSRFATGHVLMFNQVTAHHLRSIAKREAVKCATGFENELGVRVHMDEKVFTGLLFAEGGKADARTVRSKAETFFNDEIFELFRLMASEKRGVGIEKLEDIHITVALPEEDAEISAMFENPNQTEVLVFGEDSVAALCMEKANATVIHHAKTKEEAAEILEKRDIRFLLLDFKFLPKTKETVLNAEDMPSVGRDFFRYMRKYHTDIPVYLLQREGAHYSDEEMVSFYRLGMRGVIPLEEDGTVLEEKLGELCVNMNQQDSMLSLAKENKILTFETAQTVSADGKTAEITLFDFKTEQAMEAEDAENVVSDVSRPNVRFDEVIGAGDAKKELQYFVSYLKNPKKFRGTGVKAPKGVLLYGPPGTGKTMLAKAMASESGVTFIAAEGNQFLKKYVGEGPEAVHSLFRTARKYAPAILFIDEIDAIGKERTGSDRSDITADVLTAFLTEMDGFKQDPKKPIFVLAATNFDVEPGSPKSLDGALMRRFDRRIYIDLPDKEDRLRFMRKKIEGSQAFVLSEEKIENLAIRSTGMSLALLESVFEMALRSAVRDGNLKVTDEILDEAFETFQNGEVKAWDISQLERVARHEAGHAFLCWKSGETPSYLTVVARGNHGGYMQHADNEGKAIYTKEELLSRIRTSLGGRAAEIVYYGEKDGISTGASGDLASATRMAHGMICTYGMSSEIGLATFDEVGTLPENVRNEINRILATELENAVRLIGENKKAMDAMVEILLSKNHVSGPEIDAIFREHVE